MPLQNIHVHSLTLLIFLYYIIFDVERALENAKLLMLDRLQLKNFFSPFPLMVGAGGRSRIFFQQNIPVFYKN